jgi:non-specific serine/threonine protein kinase/serine/threonine-protein kinase
MATAEPEGLSPEELETWIRRLRLAGPAPASRGGDLAGGPLPADAVPGYCVLSEMGRGGQGVVYRALQTATRREVALKLLREGPLANEATRRRFAREMELAASLDHPGIVTVFEGGETAEGRPFVAMEVVDGRPIAGWARDGSVPLRARVELLRGVCEALEHAHRRGVIHLDLKPSNVLVTAEGRAKILDFGLARSLLRGDAARTLTRDLALGTPAYMAPEQIGSGPEHWDTRTDVYGLGLLLFETLSGAHPCVVEGAPLEVMRAMATARPRRLAPLLRARPGLTPREVRDLDAIAARCLARDPDGRYPDAGAVARDLEAVLCGAIVAARAHERGYALRAAVRQHRVALALGAAAFLVLAATALAYRNISAEQARLRALADERFAQVRSLARTFIHELDPAIRHLPGAAPARERIVSEALRYLDRLSATSAVEPELRLELAEAYLAVGSVLASRHQSSLGRPADARAAFETALRHLDALDASGGDPLRLARLRFRASRAIAYPLHLLGEEERAEHALAEGIETILSLVRARPDDPGLRRDHAAALDEMAHREARGGRMSEAIARQLEAQALFEQILQDDPQDAALRRDAAVGHSKLGQLRARAGETEAALHEYRLFLGEVESLQATTGRPLVERTDVAAAHEWCGRLEADLGRPQAALPHLRQAAALWDLIVAADPDHVELAMSRASTVNRLGEAELAAGRLEDAAAAFERFLSLAAGLRAAHDELPDAHRLYGVALYKQSELHQARARGAPGAEERRACFDQAAAALAQARDVFAAMAARGILAASDAAVPAELEAELRALERERSR